MSRNFLPVTKEEMEERGIFQPDFVYISGDAYVDHPSFGMAIITRLLESRGYSVGIISQPDWKKKRALPFSENPGLLFWCLPEIWIPWSTTIQWPESTGKPTPILREEKWVSDRTGL